MKHLILPLFLVCTTLLGTESFSTGNLVKQKDGYVFHSRGENLVRGEIFSKQELPAGEYAVSLEMKGRSKNSGMLYTFFEHPKGQNATYSNSLVPTEWSSFQRIVKLEKPGRVRLFLGGSNVPELRIRSIAVHPTRSASGMNLLGGDGLFRGKKGDFPPSWSFSYASPVAGSGFTEQFGYENSPTVLLLKAGTKGFAFCSGKFFFPKNGLLTLRLTARAANGAPALKLFLLGDQYRFQHKRTFVLKDQWQECVLQARVPEQIIQYPTFWARLDVPANESVLIAKAELTITPEKAQKTEEKQVRNLLPNPDFLSGSFGWSLYEPAETEKTAEQLRNRLFTPAPEFRKDALHLFPSTSLISEMIPIQPNRTYSVLFRIRSAEKGKPASGRFFGIDGAWHILSGEFHAGDQWTTVSLSGKFPPSKLNRAYVRLDVRSGAAEIERAGLIPGTWKDFPPDEPLRFGFQGRNIIEDTERDAELELRIRMNPEIRKVVDTELSIRDIFGNVVRKEIFLIEPRKEQSRKIRINQNGVRGTFFITVRSGKYRTDFSYAVLKRLDQIRLKENPLAGHIRPHLQSVDRKIYDRYFGFRQMKFNRFFGRVIDLKRHPDLAEAFRTLHPFSIVCLTGTVTMDSEFATNEALTPELREKFEAYIRKAVRSFRGCVGALELFNEPELWRYNRGPEKGIRNMPVSNVVEYYRIARKVIEEEAPEMKLAGPVVWKEYGEEFIRKGGAKLLDIYTYHNYNETPDRDREGTWKNLQKYRTLLRQYSGKELPLWNTEQYYGIREYGIFSSDEEATRAYFFTNDFEFSAVCAENLIHHAAGGSAWSMFLPRFFWDGLQCEENRVTGGAASVNAAIEILHNAGRGHEFPLGDALKCFLFPNAEEGPLAAIYATDSQTRGSMKIPENVRGFDMVGNPISGSAATISVAPVYLRFPGGTSLEQAATELKFHGLGAPVRSRVFFSSPREISCALISRSTRKESLTFQLLSLPESWRVKNAECKAELKPGEKLQLRFPLAAGTVEPMKKYRLKTALHGSERRVEETEISALFVPEAESFEGVPSYPVKNPTPDYLPGTGHRGAEDLSARFSCIWNTKGFGIRVVVRDDKPVFPEHTEGAWAFDSLQLYFDLNRNATEEDDRFGRNRSDDLDYLIGFLKGKTPFAFVERGSRFIGEGNQTRGIDGLVRTDIRRNANHELVYTVFFPSETLPDLPLRSGTLFGFSLLINDNDGQGRKTGLTLAPRGREPYQKPHLYLDVILIGKQQSASPQ